MAEPTRPAAERRQSRVPGGFDPDLDLSPVKSHFDVGLALGDKEPKGHAGTNGRLLRSEGNNSLVDALSEEEKSELVGDDSALEEKEMRRRLEDMDSSFLPDHSLAGHAPEPADDDILLMSEDQPRLDSPGASVAESRRDSDGRSNARPYTRDSNATRSPATPPEMYQTPVYGHEEMPEVGESQPESDENYADSSSQGPIPLSPTPATAAGRTLSRVMSVASLSGYETANDAEQARSDHSDELDPDPNLNKTPPNPIASIARADTGSPTPTKPPSLDGPALANRDDKDDMDNMDFSSPKARRRPKFLKSRLASQRSSYSSYTTDTTTTTRMDGVSDVTLGADYALQSGGAIPSGGSLTHRPGELSRVTSLGSMASGISALSDEDNMRTAGSIPDQNLLSTLDEEDWMTPPRTGVETPRATRRALSTPTDTVIAQRVRSVQVPATVAREFGDQYRQTSPEKRNGAPTPSINRHGKNLTLKEQGSTIDRLVKENWDLKLKVSFLSDALNKRSEEGVKAVLSENIDLRTAKVEASKEIRELKRSIRDFERKLREKTDQLTENAQFLQVERERVARPSREDLQDIDNEIAYLRERVTTYEVEIERMNHDSTVREAEKRRLADVLKNSSERRGSASDIGAREEMVCCCWSKSADGSADLIYRTCGETFLKPRRLAGNKQMKTTENCVKSFGD